MRIPIRLTVGAIGLAAITAAPMAQASVNLGVGGYLSTRMNSNQMTTAASYLKEMNAGWTRQEFNYDNIGGANGSNFGADDEAVNKSAAQSVKIVGLLNYSNSTPSSADWQSFVRNTVTHFAGKVAIWEVFNEPNDTAIASHYLQPSTYNDYLYRSYTIIKQVDPSAYVMSGSLAGVDMAYLNSLFDYGGCQYLDVVGIHPYRTLSPESQKFGEGDILNNIGRAVSVMRSRCKGKTVAVTEMGVRSDVATPGQQADYLARSFIMSQYFSDVSGLMSYNLKDDSSGAWGVVDTNMAKKLSFGRVQDVFTNLSGKSFAGELTATDRRVIDAFDNRDGWGNPYNINSAFWTDPTTGTTGQGMAITYQFNAGSAAAILTKDIALDGQPTALGIDVKGDDTPTIYRIRFTDATGQTFQGLLGNGVSSWRYLQFDFSHKDAMTYWGGANDGNIHYPIHFNSIVLDRDGGASRGTVNVDSLVAVYGPADYYAFEFGKTIAAWKGLGSGTTTIKGKTVGVSETPVYYTDDSTPSTPVQTYHASWVSQTDYPTLSAGQSGKFQVTLTNTGTATWSNSFMHLGTDRGQDRIPRFIREDVPTKNASGWSSANRVSMVESSVAPGATGTFQFYYTVPSNLPTGVYREYFRPVADGYTWMDDLGIYWDITVDTGYHAAWVSQSAYPKMSAGSSNMFEVTLLNNGTQTWTRDVMHIGTDRSQDRIPRFIREDVPTKNASGWSSANRVSMVESSVAPGQIGTFRFYYTVPSDLPAGTYREYFRPVADGYTWMENMGIYWDITVQ